MILPGPLEAARRWIAAHERASVALLALCPGAAFGARLLRPEPIGIGEDWDYTLLSQSLPAHAVGSYGELPLWTPYTCGGMPFLGNPQSRIGTPWFLFHLLFGADIGLRLELVAHVALAFGGAYFLARTLGLSRFASVTSGLVFPTCSFHYAHFAVGHAATALPLAYLPWPLALAFYATEQRRYLPAVGAGAVIALCFGEGGAYATMYSILALGVILPMLAWQRRDVRPLLVLAVIAGSVIAFGAWKFLPTYELMRVNPRHTTRPDGFFPPLMLRALFSRHQELGQVNTYQRWGWHEYSAYVSPAFALLAALGATLERRRTWLLTACAALFGALAVGYLFTIWEPKPRPLESPWTLLHRIPPFNSLRVPARFMALVVLFAGALAGFGTDALLRRRDSRVKGWLALLVAASVVDAWLVGTPNLEHAFAKPPIMSAPAPAAPSGPFAQYLDLERPLRLGDDGNASTRMSVVASKGLGVVNCYEPIRPPRAARGRNEPGYAGEHALLGPGSLRLTGWTPGSLTFEVNVPEATTLVVNQNFDSHFRVVEGTGDVRPEGGLLAVRVPAGSQTLRLVYRCWAFVAGAFVGFVALAGAVALWLHERRNGPLADT
jgi:hypothetical protein